MEMPSESLLRLRELTEALPSLAGITIEGSQHGVVRQFEAAAGEPITEHLVYTEQAVAVGVDRATKGTISATHVHKNETEHFVVCCGTLRVCIALHCDVLLAGETICVPPNTPHSVEAVEDVTFLAITVPAAEGMR